VESVLDHLSAEACYARRGACGGQLIEAKGFAAAFRHRTSRAGDPQLHTHVVVPNMVQGTDGRWSAPDGRHLYLWQKASGTPYQSALRAELRPLGLAWHVRRNGLGELRDIPKTILRAFSHRRADIEASMEQRGSTSAKAAEITALATRQRKPARMTSAGQLHEGWTAQLAAIEVPDVDGGNRPASVDELTSALGNEQATSPGREDTEGILRVLAGEKGVSLDDLGQSSSINTGEACAHPIQSHLIPKYITVMVALTVRSEEECSRMWCWRCWRRSLHRARSSASVSTGRSASWARR
jgi:hypothetical protein